MAKSASNVSEDGVANVSVDCGIDPLSPGIYDPGADTGSRSRVADRKGLR
jgi:hypothetical protein